MIRRIMVRPLKWMKDFVEATDVLYDLEEIQNPIAIISIRDPEDNEINRLIHNQFMDAPTLFLQFYDLDFNHNVDSRSEIVMTRLDAANVIDFLNKLIEDSQEFTLIVHCTAGISRSGAVGEFASDLAGIPFKTFKEENPYILPNASMKNLMRHVMREQDQDDSKIQDHQDVWKLQNGILVNSGII